MKTVTSNERISLAELKQMSGKMFQKFVKAVVDIEKGVMVVDAGMHVDEEVELLKNGSKQENLWGINLRPEETKEAFIEFDSMINIRPNQGNRSRGVDDETTQKKIREVVQTLMSL